VKLFTIVKQFAKEQGSGVNFAIAQGHLQHSCTRIW